MMTFLLIFILLVLLWKAAVIVLAAAVILAAIAMVVMFICTLRDKRPTETEIVSTGYTMKDSKAILKFIDSYSRYIHTGKGERKTINYWNENERYMFYVLVRIAHEQGMRVKVSVDKKDTNV